MTKCSWTTVVLSLIGLLVCLLPASGQVPYLQSVSSTGAKIVWTADGGEGSAECDAESGKGGTVRAKASEAETYAGSRHSRRYIAVMSGLEPATAYSCRIQMDGAALSEGIRVRTAGEGPFTFLAFGDSGTGSEAQKRLAARMSRDEDPDLVIHSGDVSQTMGDPSSLEANYFDVYEKMLAITPFFTAPGNHDYYTDFGAPYRSMVSPPGAGVPAEDAGRYYSFDWSNAHFVSLDSNILELGEESKRMLDWLETDLGRSTKFWKIVYFHHPPYASGHHKEDPLVLKASQEILPILERHGVQLVLNGHEHSYQRTKALRGGEAAGEDEPGTVYVITAGGGGNLHWIDPGPLVEMSASAHHYLRCEVEGMRMKVTAIGLDGEAIDSFTLAPPPRITDGGIAPAGAREGRLAPGSLISIEGLNLSGETQPAPDTPLPETLGGTEVWWRGRPAPLVEVRPVRIVAQLPFGQTGAGRLRVKTPNGVAETEIELLPAAPVILPWPDEAGEMAPAVFHIDTGELVTENSRARPGEAVGILVSGLGDVHGDVEAGSPWMSWPGPDVRERVEVWLGSMPLGNVRASMAPGQMGVYEVSAVLPAKLRTGEYELQVRANHASSERVRIFVSTVRSLID